jgi:Fe-S-cluster containining protein
VTKVSLKILKKHNLGHISELRIDPEILLHRFSPGCSMCHCNGTCCAEGVLLDLKDKERILAHADLIKKYLEPQQDHDAAKWFDHKIEYDIDFPSGRCDGTAVRDGGCVFLDNKGLCALQKTAMAEGMDKFALKPFYCVAFPLVIDGHVLTTDDPEFTNRSQCCSIVPDGSLTVLDVCREEFEYILGTEGLEEIEQVFKKEVASLLVNIV